jgi:hypothetical protein
LRIYDLRISSLKELLIFYLKVDKLSGIYPSGPPDGGAFGLKNLPPHNMRGQEGFLAVLKCITRVIDVILRINVIMRRIFDISSRFQPCGV